MLDDVSVAPALSVGPLSNTAPLTYKLLSQSLDWLTCNVEESFPDDRLVELVRLSDQSPAGAIESPYSFLGVPLMVKRGFGSCVFILHAKEWFSVRILADGAAEPSQVTIYSRPLWEHGNEAAISAMQGFVDTLWCAVGVALIPSRVDFSCDVTGFPVRQFDSRSETRSRFVTRLRELDMRGSKDTETVYLGKDGAVRVSLYNKTADCLKKGKDYYFPTWRGNGWLGLEHEEVTRVEYKCMREFFRSWHVSEDGIKRPLRDVWELLDQLPAMWEYLTLSHTRMVIPDPSDSNQSRFDLDPVWVVVASPWSGDVTPNPGSRFSHYSNDRDKLEKQVSGGFLSFAALLDCGEDYSPSELGRGFLAMLSRLESRKGKHWRQLVTERRAVLLGRAA